MSLAGAAVQGMRGADTGLKNGITQAAFACAGFTHNANHGFVVSEFTQMFQDVTGKRVRQGGERFFNCLNGIRRIHTCIPGEKRQNDTS